jgi:signal transduction histidine kinase
MIGLSAPVHEVVGKIHMLIEQQVSIMGDFSDSFNKMIEALRLKQELEDELRDSDELHHMLRMVYTSSESTYVLLENLLAWSENRSKTIPYFPGKHFLKPIFDDTIQLYGSAVEVKEINITITADPLLEALFDPPMIRTVIRNLVNNAIKFTPKSGTINMGARSLEGQVEIFVRDSGIGMSPEIIHSLFNPATTAVRNGTNQEKGHGLGLSLCHEMVIRDGGRLKMESEEGKGTTISFRLSKA